MAWREQANFGQVTAETLTLSSTLAITGATTLSSTLAVTGNATFGGTVGVTGAISASSTLTAAGAITSSAGIVPPEYAVSGLPAAAAGNSGFVVYVSDGNAGEETLAISNGTNWVSLATGATCATS